MSSLRPPPTSLDDVETIRDGHPTEPKGDAISSTRGLSPRAVAAWVRARHGDQAVLDLAAVLPERVRDDVGGPTLRAPLMGWVPFLSHCELLATVDAMFGNGDLSLLHDVGHAAAYRDMPSIARPFARFVSPTFLVDMMTKIWRVYHTHGTWEVSRGRRDFQAVLVGRPENHPAFCPVLRGYVEGAMKVAGAVEVDVTEERCANRGAPCCSLRVTWSEKRDAPKVRDRLPRAPL